MGIRFRCHHCEQELNLKTFQAGRRARCPECTGRFRVPTISQDFSLPLEDFEQDLAQASTTAVQTTVSQSKVRFELQQPVGERDSIVEPVGDDGSFRQAAQSPFDAGERKPVDYEMPRAIAEAPEAVWYVRPPSGGQFGPADGRVFFEWMKDNRVARDALVWRDGWPQWLMAAEAFEDTFGTRWPLQTDTDGPILAADGPIASDGSVALLPSEPSAADDLASLGQTGSVPAGGTVQRDPIATARRRRVRKNYAIGISVLAVLAIALISVLIYVLAFPTQSTL